MRHIYTPNNGFERVAEGTQCRQAIANHGMSVGFHQCTRKPKVTEKIKGKRGTFGFCKQHSTEEIERREREWQAKYQASTDAFRRRAKRKEAEGDCFDVVLAMTEGAAKKAGLPAGLWKRVQEIEDAD